MIEEFGEIKRMELRPDDVIVLELRGDELFGSHQLVVIRDQLDQAFPDHACVVVAHGTLSIVGGAA